MKLTPEKLTAFCAALAETCNVGKAAAAVGISRYTAYIWRKEDSDFAERWDDALKAGLLMLEDEAHRRAFDGVEEPITHQGQLSYQLEHYIDEEGKQQAQVKRDENGQPIPLTVKKYSDTLAIFLLKAHAPEKYRENTRMELTGAEGGPVQFTDSERAAKLAAIVAAAQARKDGDVSDLV